MGARPSLQLGGPPHESTLGGQTPPGRSGVWRMTSSMTLRVPFAPFCCPVRASPRLRTSSPEKYPGASLRWKLVESANALPVSTERVEKPEVDTIHCGSGESHRPPTGSPNQLEGPLLRAGGLSFQRETLGGDIRVLLRRPPGRNARDAEGTRAGVSPPRFTGMRSSSTIAANLGSWRRASNQIDW